MSREMACLYPMILLSGPDLRGILQLDRRVAKQRATPL
jgi:hypothetical protein